LNAIELGFYSPYPGVVYYNIKTFSRLTGRCKSGINAAFVQANWHNVPAGPGNREAMVTVLHESLGIPPDQCLSWTVRIADRLLNTELRQFIAGERVPGSALGLPWNTAAKCQNKLVFKK
jgi:hypothetical protein